MRRSLLAAPLALAIALLVPAEAAHSAGTITASTDAVALGKAMMADTEWVTDAAFETKAPGNSAGLVSGEINGLPTSGENALGAEHGRRRSHDVSQHQRQQRHLTRRQQRPRQH